VDGSTSSTAGCDEAVDRITGLAGSGEVAVATESVLPELPEPVTGIIRRFLGDTIDLSIRQNFFLVNKESLGIYRELEKLNSITSVSSTEFGAERTKKTGSVVLRRRQFLKFLTHFCGEEEGSCASGDLQKFFATLTRGVLADFSNTKSLCQNITERKARIWGEEFGRRFAFESWCTKGELEFGVEKKGIDGKVEGGIDEKKRRTRQTLYGVFRKEIRKNMGDADAEMWDRDRCFNAYAVTYGYADAIQKLLQLPDTFRNEMSKGCGGVTLKDYWVTFLIRQISGFVLANPKFRISGIPFPRIEDGAAECLQNSRPKAKLLAVIKEYLTPDSKRDRMGIDVKDLKEILCQLNQDKEIAQDIGHILSKLDEELNSPKTRWLAEA